jgi:hypothetical protein
MAASAVVASYIMVLVYSPFMIVAEPRNDLVKCVAEAKGMLGKPLEVKMWDNMGGSNPIPKVMIAFCAEGGTLEGAGQKSP